jgi:hypothetical protein
MMSSMPLVGDLDGCPTGEFDGAEGVLSPILEDDVPATIRGLKLLVGNLIEMPLVGDLDAPLTGEFDDATNDQGGVPTHRGLFSGVARVDGRAMTADDDRALLEFTPLAALHLAFDHVLGRCDADSADSDSGAFFMFPAADDDLAAWGELLCQAQADHEAKRDLRRVDGEVFTDPLPPYSSV